MKKPIYKRWYVWVIIIVVLSCIIAPFLPETENKLTSAPTLSASATQISPTPGVTIAPTPTSTPEATATPSSTPEASSTPDVTATPTSMPEPIPVSTTVYITATGEKYHRGTCRTLSESKIETTLDNAKTRGYDPCGICKPPQ